MSSAKCCPFRLGRMNIANKNMSTALFGFDLVDMYYMIHTTHIPLSLLFRFSDNCIIGARGPSQYKDGLSMYMDFH